MQRLLRLYRLINILSLDIVAGAVVCALFFSELFHVEILSYGLISLALTVWIIYTADHLRDAKTITHTASSERHHFHQQHFKFLLALMCLAIILDSVVILFTRKPVFEWGVVLAFIVGVYLIIQRYLKVLKEMFVAALYTAGVLLPSLSTTSVMLDLFYSILIIQFALIAWVNLLIFSWFDYESDCVDRQSSFVTIAGKSFTSVFVWLLSAINFILGIFLWCSGFYKIPELIFLLMNSLLLVIFICSREFNKRDAFRLIGDAVFFIPGIYWLWMQG